MKQWPKIAIVLAILGIITIVAGVVGLIAPWEREAPPGGQAPPGSETSPSAMQIGSASKVTADPSAYDGQTIEVSGQVYATGSSPRLLVGSKGGFNLAGDTTGLWSGFYQVTGMYDAETNTLKVSASSKLGVDYLSVEQAKQQGMDLAPVKVEGLIAMVPKEVVDKLTNYISVPHFPQNLSIFPYVVYTQDALYLVLSDHPDIMPTEFRIVYQETTYRFYFSAGEVKGTLVKTPMAQINFGSQWAANEFGGIIIAESLAASEPVSTTVRQIYNDPAYFAFKRVTIDGTYLVATATLDYSEAKVPFGVGILADNPTELLFEEYGPRIETIDPERKTWQLRQGEVIGTVLYPTDEVLAYLDYSAPLTKQQIATLVKPVLIVDTLVEDVVQVANIAELNPVNGNPSQYWGKVVEFESYALGVNLPLKEVASAVAGTEIPVNVNLLAVGIADSLTIGSQLVIIGLNNELLEYGDPIMGKYKFRVAISQIPDELVGGIPYANTAFFLLDKEELAFIPPTQFYELSTSVSPSGTGMVEPSGGDYVAGIDVPLLAIPDLGYVFDHWSGDASVTLPVIIITMNSDKSVTAHFKPIW